MGGWVFRSAVGRYWVVEVARDDLDVSIGHTLRTTNASVIRFLRHRTGLDWTGHGEFMTNSHIYKDTCSFVPSTIRTCGQKRKTRNILGHGGGVHIERTYRSVPLIADRAGEGEAG